MFDGIVIPWSRSTPKLRNSQTLVYTGVLDYMGGGEGVRDQPDTDVRLATKNSNLFSTHCSTCARPTSSPKKTAKMTRYEQGARDGCNGLFPRARLYSPKQHFVHNTTLLGSCQQ